MWDLPGPGLEPMSPALAGGFLTTVPPGKSELIVVLTGISFIISDVEYLFTCLLVICVSSLDNFLFKSFVPFLVGLLVFLLLSCGSSLYILDLTSCQIYGLKIFSPIL